MGFADQFAPEEDEVPRIIIIGTVGHNVIWNEFIGIFRPHSQHLAGHCRSDGLSRLRNRLE